MKKKMFISAEQKVELIRQVVIEGKKISDVCEENKVSPKAFYLWRAQLFKEAPVLFTRKNDSKLGAAAQKKNDEKINELESELAKKNEVISELMQEYLEAKKSNGVI